MVSHPIQQAWSWLRLELSTELTRTTFGWGECNGSMGFESETESWRQLVCLPTHVGRASASFWTHRRDVWDTHWSEVDDTCEAGTSMDGEEAKDAAEVDCLPCSPPKTWNKAKRAVRKPKRFLTSPAAAETKGSKKSVAFAKTDGPCTPLGKRGKVHVQFSSVGSQDKENRCPTAAGHGKSMLPGGAEDANAGLDLLFQVSEQAVTPAAKATTPSRTLEPDQTNPDTMFSPNTMAAATTVMQLAERKRTISQASNLRGSKSSKRALLKPPQPPKSCTQHTGETEDPMHNPPGTSQKEQQEQVVFMPGFGESSFRAFLDFLTADLSRRVEVAKMSKNHASECIESIHASPHVDKEAYERAVNLFQCTHSGLAEEIHSLERRIRQIDSLREAAATMCSKEQPGVNNTQDPNDKPSEPSTHAVGNP